MMYFEFNENKAIAALLYISDQLINFKDLRSKPDLHKIFKILYFADLYHISKYGRPIVGDHYIAMEHGPVPSRIYDIVKIVRGDSLFDDMKGYCNILEVDGNHYVKPKKSADMEEFSETDIECIDKSIEENKFLSFPALKRKSHDGAYNCATKDDKISFNEMAKVAGASEALLNYLRTHSENERVLKR